MNPTYGSGQHSHEVPAQIGVVVEMRDGQHAGTAVWRRDRHDLPFVFASFDSRRISFAERCVLVAGQDIDSIPFGDAAAIDTEPQRGLMLLGIDEDDDLQWLSEGAEVLWDSKMYEVAP